MKKMNWRTVALEIAEAREQLQKIEQDIASGNPPNEERLKIDLRHAYHHLNFAWNARHAPSERYGKLPDEDFRVWGKYPRDIEKD
jgi:hypothetical protein